MYLRASEIVTTESGCAGANGAREGVWIKGTVFTKQSHYQGHTLRVGEHILLTVKNYLKYPVVWCYNNNEIMGFIIEKDIYNC